MNSDIYEAAKRFAEALVCVEKACEKQSQVEEEYRASAEELQDARSKLRTAKEQLEEAAARAL